MFPSISTSAVSPIWPPGRRVQPPPPPPPPPPLPLRRAVFTTLTVTRTVAGLWTTNPSASVQANDTGKVPVVLKTTPCGFCSVEVLGLAPPAKFQRNVNGTLLSGSVHVPAKSTLVPVEIVRSAGGLLIWLSGGLLTVTVRVAGAGSTPPVASVHVNVTGKTPGVGKVMSPGFCTVVDGATPLKFQAKVKGWFPSASTQFP
jgi:hypothetical protein